MSSCVAADAGHDDHTSEAVYWWSHTTLGEEAAPPDTTAAEAAAAALTAVADAVQASLTAVLTSTPAPLGSPGKEGQGEAWYSTAPLPPAGAAQLYTRLGLGERLPPLLAQVRRAMERTWWEQRAVEEGSAKAGGRGPAALDERARGRLAEVQRQVYVLFLQAAVRGATEAFLASPEEVQQEQRHLLPTCVDALLTDMCFGLRPTTEGKARDGLLEEEDEGEGTATGAGHGSQTYSRAWRVGFLSSLRSVPVSGGGARSPDEKAAAEVTEATELATLLGYVANYLHGELGIDAGERALNTPLLCGAAAHRLHATLRGLAARADRLATAAEAGTADHAQSLAAFFQGSAAVALRSIGDGLLLRSPEAHARGCAPLLSLSTPTYATYTLASAALLFRTASLAAVSTLAAGETYLAATTQLLDVCHRAYGRALDAGSGAACGSGTGEPTREEARGGEREPDAAAARKALTAAYHDRLGTQALYLVAVLGQQAATSPLLLPALHAITVGFYPSDTSGNSRRLLGDLVTFLDSHEPGSQLRQGSTAAAVAARTPGPSPSPSAAPAQSLPRPWSSFAEACVARVAAMMPGLMESPPPALLATLSSPATGAPPTGEEEAGAKAVHAMSEEVGRIALPLAVALVVRPTQVLAPLLLAAVNPSMLSRSGLADRAVTESGGGSGSRATAFDEAEADAAGSEADPTRAHRAAMAHFPRLYSLFCATEAAMRLARWAPREAGDVVNGQVRSPTPSPMSGGDAEPLSVDVVWRAHVGDAVAEALLSMMRDGAAEVAVGQVLMCISFLLSPTPAYPAECLPNVCAALQRTLTQLTLAGGAVGDTGCTRDDTPTTAAGAGAGDARVRVLRAIHALLTRRRHYGVAVYLLPLLRALGVDHGAATEAAQTAIGVGYPAAAHVAFLAELPHGYFCQSPHRIALNQASDAIAYLDELVFSQLPRGTGGDGCQEGGETGGVGESAELFIDIVAEAGGATLARLREVAYARPTDTLLGGVPTAESSGVAGPPLHPVLVDVLGNVFMGVLRLCADVNDWDRSARAELQRRIVERTRRKLLAGVGEAGRGATPTRDCMVLPATYLLRSGHCRDLDAGPRDDERAASTVAGAGEGGAGALTHVERWLWAVELEAIDDAPFAAVKSLVRVCNLSYMRQVSTQTLLRCRSAVDARGDALRAARPALLGALSEAVASDIARIREGLDAQARAAAAAAAAAATAQAEAARRAQEEAAQATEEGEAVANEAEAREPERTTAPGEAAAHPKPQPPTVPPRALALADLQPYVERVFAALLLRARLSVVDGAVCGLGVERFLLALPTCGVPPRTVTALVRQFVEQLRGRLAHARPAVCTRQEAAALSIVMRHVAQNVALGFKMSFHPPPGLTGPSRERVMALGAALGRDEADAVATLTTALDAVTSLVKTYLSRLTLIGDWSAWALVHHCSGLLRLVGRYDEVVTKALALRRESIRRSGIPSPGFQALVAVERPLGEGMTEPAVSVSRLYTTTTTTAATPVARSAGSGAAPARRGEAIGGRPEKREGERERVRGGQGDRGHHREARGRADSPARGGGEKRTRSGAGAREPAEKYGRREPLTVAGAATSAKGSGRTARSRSPVQRHRTRPEGRGRERSSERPRHDSKDDRRGGGGGGGGSRRRGGVRGSHS